MLPKMKKIHLIISFLFMVVPLVRTDYTAAVVEFRPTYSNQSIQDNMVFYSVQIQDACFSHHAKIIVFPEYGLTGLVEDPTEYALEVPEVGEFVTLSNKTMILYEIAKSAWCGIYVVLNVLEKANNTNNETVYYNTNIVFDSKSTIVAKYRKINLYNEPKLTPGDPSQNKPIFKTDFNVTFGMFTGSDMLSYNPSRSIFVNSSVTDVILPTAWFSTLPFFHSLSFHSGYAMANKVNLLVATNHNFSEGIGGSGIYGSDGKVLSYYISESVGRWNSKPLYSVVSKTNNTVTNNTKVSQVLKLTSPIVGHFQAHRYFDSDHYTFKDLNLTQKKISEEICDGSFCCSFEIVLSSSVNTSEIYKLMAHSGQYKLGELKRDDVEICSLLACETSDSSTCGTANVSVISKFQSISVKTNVTEVARKFYQPVTLTTDLLPVFNTTYNSTVVVNATRSIIFSTNLPEEKVLVFGIYGNSGNVVGTTFMLLVAAVSAMYMMQ